MEFLSRSLLLGRCAPSFPIKGRPHNILPRQFIPIALFLVSSVLPAASGFDPELCVVKTPLKSPYFIPYVAVSAPCLGCIFPNPRSNASRKVRIDDKGEISVTSVHIIEVKNPQIGSFELILQLDSIAKNTGRPNLDIDEDDDTEDRWIALVLAPKDPDAAPISFAMSLSPSLHNRSLLLMVRSRDKVEMDGESIKSVLERPKESYEEMRGKIVTQALNSSLESLLDEAKRLFGFFTSFTKTLSNNRAAFNLTPLEDGRGQTDHECEEEVIQRSPIAQCSGLVPKQTSGCYHEALIGTNEKDIHIIEVEMSSTDESHSHFTPISLLVKGIDMDSHLVPSRTGYEGEKESNFSTGFVHRNLTLVLRSNRPTAWTVRVDRLQGNVILLVGRGDQVENKSSETKAAAPAKISVQKLELPQTFDQMILSVFTSIGLPVSYTKTQAPDLIAFGVPSSADSAVLSTVNPTLKETSLQTIEPDTANALISRYLKKECGVSQAVVTIPLWVAERLGGVDMSLRDVSCSEKKNTTHVLVVASYSECGFQHEVFRGDRIYTNFLRFQIGKSFVQPMIATISDDEDFEGSGYGLEDASPTRIRNVIVKCEMGLHGKTASYPSSEDGGAFDYILMVYPDRRFSQAYNQFPVVLLKGEQIHARIAVDNALSLLSSTHDLRLIVEKCWLSSSAQGDMDPFFLIRKSCPVDSSVHIRKDHIHLDVRFAFKIPPNYPPNQNFYLHCQIGVCSQAILPKPTYKKCVDPDSYCQNHRLVNVFANQAGASHVASLLTGPFVLHASNDGQQQPSSIAAETMTARLGELNAVAANSKSQAGQSPASPIVVLEGLSTEAVVGIAVAAFGIGVFLTATLWFIYAKTDPRRQKRPSESQMPRNSGYDLSAHSGSSTPSSQAPMTA